MNTEHKSDEELKQYLLGEMAPSDREELEKCYLADGTLHERLLAMEEELLDLHLNGHLSPTQSESLMQNLRGAANGFDRLAFARALAQVRQERRQVQQRSVFWRILVPIPVVASIILAAVVWRDVHHPGTMQQQPSPAVTVSPGSTPDSLETRSDKGTQSGPGHSAAQNDHSSSFELRDQAASAENYPILRLRLGADRGADRGAMVSNKLPIPDGRYRVRLSAKEPGRFEVYSSYLQRVHDHEHNRNNETVLRPNRMLRKGGVENTLVTAEFDSDRLASGKYILVIQGQHPGHAKQTIAEYQFSVFSPHAQRPKNPAR